MSARAVEVNSSAVMTSGIRRMTAQYATQRTPARGPRAAFARGIVALARGFEYRADRRGPAATPVTIEIPEPVRRAARDNFGAHGEDWLAGLPARVDALARSWG